ncbi:MAG: helix-turn-helix transcriptional regulator [Janthinobacterium lividum]
MPKVHQTPSQHNWPTLKLRPSVARAIPGDAQKLPESTAVFFPQAQGEPAPSPTAPAMRFLTMKEVVLRTGFQKSFLYFRIRGKTFPPPIKVGQSARFIESEIVAIQRAWAIGSNPDELRRLVVAVISAR